MAQGTTLYYVDTDQLNTPRALINATGTVVWRWTGEAFGDSPAEEDPDADATDIAYNLRFAGQYYDRETNTFYNGARDYDPAIGRYLQSDPIGLAGGINTYAYVGGNPLGASDSSGLFTPLSALIGGVIGGIYGGVTAYSSGADGQQIAEAVGLGVFTGAISGFTLGPISSTLVYGVAGLTGNVVGQYASGTPLPNINYTSAVTSGVIASAGGFTSWGGSLFGTSEIMNGILVGGLTTNLEIMNARLANSSNGYLSDAGLASDILNRQMGIGSLFCSASQTIGAKPVVINYGNSRSWLTPLP